jgi:hypothetical protein
MRASSIDLSVLLASMDKIPEPATAPDLGRRTARASRLAPARRCRKMRANNERAEGEPR